jgi:hypothetical protein
MIKDHIMNKSEEFEGLTEEELEKSVKDAFRAGLTVLGLIHGAHYMGSPTSFDRPAPKASVEDKREMKRVPGSFKDKQVKNFVRAVHGHRPEGSMSSREFDNHVNRAYELHGQYGGDEEKMAYAWGQGSKFKPQDFEDKSHQNYKEHHSVENYQKNRRNIEKTPAKPDLTPGKFSE